MVDITEVMDEDYATPPPPHIAEGIEDGNFPPQDAWGGGKKSTDDRSRELFDDADDIEGAMEHAIRPTARLRLKNVIAMLREEGEALTKRAAAAAADPASSSADPTSATPTVEDVKAARLPPYEPAAPVPKRSPAPNVMITSNSVKYRSFPTIQFDAGGYNGPTVTVYVPLEGIGKHDRAKISCQFTSGSFDLIVSDFEGGANYRLLNDNLEHEIDVSQSKFVIKPNKIIIKLGKVKSGTESWSSYDSWTQLSSKKSKDKNATGTGGKKKDDPMGGIMDMMKDMYESGDDNMKKVIGEAMYKQRMGQKPEDMMGGGAGGGMGMDGF
jgi:calcyclin binding protein